LVGARPITRYEYERLFKRRGGAGTSGYWDFDLRPGLTGYWQINGRSSMDYEDRVRLDLAYLTSWSLRLDLTILAKTARVLATRRGAV
jgi:undecaprenyl-phosphate galactose phosphotransferase